MIILLVGKIKFVVIVEVKKVFFSKGVIREDFELVIIVKLYEKNGVICILVLIDKKFF